MGVKSVGSQAATNQNDHPRRTNVPPQEESHAKDYRSHDVIHLTDQRYQLGNGVGYEAKKDFLVRQSLPQ